MGERDVVLYAGESLSASSLLRWAGAQRVRARRVYTVHRTGGWQCVGQGRPLPVYATGNVWVRKSRPNGQTISIHVTWSWEARPPGRKEK